MMMDTLTLLVKKYTSVNSKDLFLISFLKKIVLKIYLKTLKLSKFLLIILARLEFCLKDIFI